jgi:hypothetical protein
MTSKILSSILACLLTTPIALAQNARDGKPETKPELRPAVLAALRSNGLLSNVGAGEAAPKPMPAFEWTFTQKRPLRSARVMHEVFTPAYEGLALVVTQKQSADKSTGARVSVRGLGKYDDDDEVLRLKFTGLKFPLQPGQNFQLDAELEGKPIQHRCTVGAPIVATTIHEKIPGHAVPITCAAETHYLGAKVKVSSNLAYLEQLGVFFNLRDDMRSSVGTFALVNTMTQFRIR